VLISSRYEGNDGAPQEQPRRMDMTDRGVDVVSVVLARHDVHSFDCTLLHSRQQGAVTYVYSFID